MFLRPHPVQLNFQPHSTFKPHLGRSAKTHSVIVTLSLGSESSLPWAARSRGGQTHVPRCGQACLFVPLTPRPCRITSFLPLVLPPRLPFIICRVCHHSPLSKLKIPVHKHLRQSRNLLRNLHLRLQSLRLRTHQDRFRDLTRIPLRCRHMHQPTPSSTPTLCLSQ